MYYRDDIKHLSGWRACYGDATPNTHSTAYLKIASCAQGWHACYLHTTYGVHAQQKLLLTFVFVFNIWNFKSLFLLEKGSRQRTCSPCHRARHLRCPPQSYVQRQKPQT